MLCGLDIIIRAVLSNYNLLNNNYVMEVVMDLDLGLELEL